jgi:hypothetical protein
MPSGAFQRWSAPATRSPPSLDGVFAIVGSSWTVYSTLLVGTAGNIEARSSPSLEGVFAIAGQQLDGLLNTSCRHGGEPGARASRRRMATSAATFQR